MPRASRRDQRRRSDAPRHLGPAHLYWLLLILQSLTTQAAATSAAQAGIAVFAQVPADPASCQGRIVGADATGKLLVAVRCIGPSPYLIGLAALVTPSSDTHADGTAEPSAGPPQPVPPAAHSAAADCLAKALECSAVRGYVETSDPPAILITITY